MSIENHGEASQWSEVSLLRQGPDDVRESLFLKRERSEERPTNKDDYSDEEEKRRAVVASGEGETFISHASVFLDLSKSVAKTSLWPKTPKFR